MQTESDSASQAVLSLATDSYAYHTITIDFILALPKSNPEKVHFLMVTDKFSKKLIPGNERYKAKDWLSSTLID